MFGLDGAVTLALAAALAMAAVHVASPRLVFLDRTPRSIWLSAAGGVSVAYVFVHLLPELARMQEEHFSDHRIDSALYLFSLAGLVAYYGLERVVARHGGGEGQKTPAGVFWLHIGSFALYNLLIGYLLDEQARLEGASGMALYAAAMALHFVVNDRALYRQHGRLYTTRGRWLLAAAAPAGWGAGLAIEIPASWIAAAIALLAGSVVLNVIKEELPEDRESRFWAFLLGTGGYAAVLMVI